MCTWSGPIFIFKPKSVLASVFLLSTGFTRTGTPWARDYELLFFSIYNKDLERLSFWARATVIGAGLSVTKFFIDAFEKLAPNT